MLIDRVVTRLGASDESVAGLATVDDPRLFDPRISIVVVPLCIHKSHKSLNVHRPLAPKPFLSRHRQCHLWVALRF